MSKSTSTAHAFITKLGYYFKLRACNWYDDVLCHALAWIEYKIFRSIFPISFVKS